MWHSSTPQNNVRPVKRDNTSLQYYQKYHYPQILSFLVSVSFWPTAPNSKVTIPKRLVLLHSLKYCIYVHTWALIISFQTFCSSVFILNITVKYMTQMLISVEINYHSVSVLRTLSKVLSDRFKFAPRTVAFTWTYTNSVISYDT